MAVYVINDKTNSFVVIKGNNSSPFSRNDLSITFSSDNDQIMKISDKSVNKVLLHEIDLSVDTVDVDGVTVFADAQALFDEIEPIFFLINSSGGNSTTETTEVINVAGTTHDTSLSSRIAHMWSSTIDPVGFDLTDNGDGTVDLSAGAADTRVSNSELADISLYDIPAEASFALVDNTTNYIYVFLNAGVPTVASTINVVEVFSRVDWAVGWVVTRLGTTLHTLDVRGQGTNYINNANIKDVQVNGFEKASGADISINGSNEIVVGDGVFYILNRPISTSGIDTSASGTFTNVYQDGGGDWTRVTGQTVLPIDNWDDGSGVLQNAGNNEFINLWLHVIHNNPAEYEILIGQDVFFTVDEAFLDTLPDLRPPEIAQFSTGDELYQITYRGNGNLERVLDLKVNAGRVVSGTPTVIPRQFGGEYVWDNATEGAAPGGFSIISVPTFLSTTPMGIPVESDSVLKYLSVMAFSSSAAAVGSFTIDIERFEKNSGTAYTAGAGTLIASIGISAPGILPPLFYRDVVDDTLNVTVGGTDPILFCHISAIGFWTIGGGIRVSVGGDI